MSARASQGWFILTYKVPSSPSTARVTIWKRVKELGAVLLQQSVYILPNLPQLKDALYHLKEQIQQFGGEYRLLEMASLEEAQEKEIIEEFNRLRNKEYEEVIEGYETLLREIDKETKAEKFYFAELEEIEKDLQKLKGWLDVVTERDFFRADLQGEVLRLMKDCEQKFNDFSHEVFSREETIGREAKAKIPNLRLRTERKVKQKERKVYTKSELIEKLKQVVSKLEDETLKVGEEQVSALPASAAMELKYKDDEGKKSLRIELKW